LLCKQWPELEKLKADTERASLSVTKFEKSKQKDSFFKEEDIQIGVNLQKLNDFVKEIVKNCL
jgi:hypothetical protein